MFLLGFTITGIIFYVIGFLIGAHFYCIGSEYAECALGGIFVGGPICFTIATIIYLFFWTKTIKLPNKWRISNRAEVRDSVLILGSSWLKIVGRVCSRFHWMSLKMLNTWMTDTQSCSAPAEFTLAAKPVLTVLFLGDIVKRLTWTNHCSRPQGPPLPCSLLAVGGSWTQPLCCWEKNAKNCYQSTEKMGW